MSEMKKQRLTLGILGFLLPVSVLFGFITAPYNSPNFWWSISATYYSRANVFMIGLLTLVAFFFFCYRGYDLSDRIVARISGVSALLVCWMPCAADVATETTGWMNFPTNISHIIHCISAGVLFGSFAWMIRFNFRKGSFLETERKKLRNKIYLVASKIILVFMLAQVATSMLGVGWATIINETIMLWAFSFAWLVKGGAFKRFADAEERKKK